MGVKGFGVGRGLGLYARHRLDLWPRDIFFGVRSCCRPWRRDRLESEVLVERVLAYGDEFPNGLEQVAPGAPDIWAQVYHANRDEWSVTVDDIIYRRTTLGIRGFDTPEVRQKIVAFCPTVAGYRRP
jgi:glycerol-3-phosphate dehydrogenase